MKIILASASPRRKELLNTAGLNFEVVVKPIDESVPDGISPQDGAIMTAKKKALAVACLYPDAVVIGADTIVVANGEVMGKPRDKAHAVSMLKTLSGKEHKVITGVCLIVKGKPECFSKTSLVKFYDLTDEEINDYVETGEPMDKAGAYGIQGRGCTLVESISGDYFNIVGLPVACVVRAIKRAEEDY